MISSLISGLVAALSVLIVVWLRDWRRQKVRLTSHWQALRSEILECGRIANRFLNDEVMVPSYRLPTVCYAHAFAVLLVEGKLTETDADALRKYYAEVETLNRGLDLVLRDDAERAQRTHDRNIVMARRICAPEGEHYLSVLLVVDRRLTILRLGI
jgi:hypothetical protein